MQLFDNKGKMEDVDLQRVHYIMRDSKSRRVLFHTSDNVYHAPSTLEEFGQAYRDYGFHRIDKNRLINVNRVSHREKGFLYIGEKKYSVSRRNELIIKKVLRNLP